MERKFIVYQITNKLNNHIYIGCHTTKNINDNYYGSGTNIRKAIQEFGKENFIKQTLFIFDNELEMTNKEKELVNIEFISRTDTYNIILGGNQFLTTDTISVKDKDGNNFKVHKTDPRYLSGELVGSTKGKIVAKDQDGNTFQVDINDPRYLSGELVGTIYGKVNVKDQDNNTLQVSITDPRYLSGELVGHSKGKVNVKDKFENILQVNINDPRYLSGELVGINYRKIIVKDTSGNNIQIYNDDSRFLSGELVHINKDKITVKDKDGNIMSINKTDPRYLSGELVGINKGIKQTLEQRQKKSGINNTVYGKIWIFNIELKQSMRINKIELDNYLLLGWNKGRKMKINQ